MARYAVQVEKNFSACAMELNRKLEVHAETGTSFDIEANFSQVKNRECVTFITRASIPEVGKPAAAGGKKRVL